MPDLARVPLDALVAQLEHALCAALRRGATRAQAAAVVGWPPARLADLLARADAPDAPRPLVRLVAAVRAAEVAFELDQLDAVGAAARAGDWRAAVWLIERRKPATEVAPAEAARGALDLAQFTDDELEQIARTGKLPTGHRGPVVYLPPEDPEGSCG